MERIAVGSTNPVKTGAAARIFRQLWSDVEVQSVAVPSGVSNQPIGDEETARGAMNRALAALKATGAQWGVGLEGGVAFQDGQCWMIQYAAVAHRNGQVNVGKGPMFLLPPVIARGVAGGGEVGPLVDELTGQKDIKRKGGAIGYLTNGLVLREDMYAHMVAAALVPFLHAELYSQ